MIGWTDFSRAARRIGCVALLLALLCAPCASLVETAEAPAQAYSLLEQGDEGISVLKLKQRLYWLGYFSSYDNLSHKYNATMTKRVKEFQKSNGLPATGDATPETQALIYSDAAIPGKTVPQRKPVVAPVTAPELPPLDERGFLTEAGGEFVFADDEDGHWYYISDSLHIEIKRFSDPNEPIVWFESEVYASEESFLRSCLTEKTKKGYYAFVMPVDIAKQNNLVLGITDDYFGHRRQYGIMQGIVIRDGELLSDRTYRSGATDKLPNLEVMAVLSDGSMKAFASDAHTGEEYLAMGAVHTLAFGPVLLTDGEYGKYAADVDYNFRKEPRCAIGMIEPYHYILLTVNGRTKTSDGAHFYWMADRMRALGVTEALNLDGGGTVSLVFMGERLNKGGTANTAGGGMTRSVTSLIGFGTSLKVAP